MQKKRLGVFVSHPIQYQAPLYRELAKEPFVDLKVHFYSDNGLRTYHDPDFGRAVKWDVPLLDGYESMFLPNRSPWKKAGGFLAHINPGVIREVWNGNFDAIWVYGWSHFSTWLVILTAILKGTPLLMRGETNLLPVLPLWKQTLKRTVLGALFTQIDAFLSIGTLNDAFYEAYGVPDSKRFWAPYCVNNRFFFEQHAEARQARASLRREWNIPLTHTVFLFMGKLSEVKRPYDLLEAFARVRKTHPSTLLFVGDGALAPSLKKYCTDHQVPDVVFAGFKNQTELAPYYAASDVFVLPSGHEPWGLVVNEAMCFGLPVVVSDAVGAAPDLVRQGVNGHVFPSGDVDALEKVLNSLLSHPEKLPEMGKASRTRMDSWSFTQIIDAVREAITGRKKQTHREAA